MQKIIYTTLLTLNISSLTQAQDFGIAVGSKKELILTGNSCEELLKQQVALCSWKKKITPDFSSKPFDKSCQQVKKGTYRLAILDCLPEFARDYQAKKLLHSGPNCWGTAMSFHNLSLRPRFMWPQEMMYWMDSPLCRKLGVNEARLPGDVINVYAPESLPYDDRKEDDPGINFWKVHYPGRYIPPTPPEVTGSSYTGFHRLLHSVTYVSDKLAFGKDSPAFDDLFYFHPMTEVYGRPRAGDETCQENQSMTPHFREYQNTPKEIRGTKCAYFTQAYRCENFARYFSAQKLTGENATRWMNIDALLKFQAKLFPLLTSSANKLSSQEIEVIKNVSDSTLKRTLEDLKQTDLDKTQEQLIVFEYFSAAGLRQTLEQMKLIKPL